MKARRSRTPGRAALVAGESGRRSCDIKNVMACRYSRPASAILPDFTAAAAADKKPSKRPQSIDQFSASAASRSCSQISASRDKRSALRHNRRQRRAAPEAAAVGLILVRRSAAIALRPGPRRPPTPQTPGSQRRPRMPQCEQADCRQAGHANKRPQQGMNRAEHWPNRCRRLVQNLRPGQLAGPRRGPQPP